MKSLKTDTDKAITRYEFTLTCDEGLPERTATILEEAAKVVREKGLEVDSIHFEWASKSAYLDLYCRE